MVTQADIARKIAIWQITHAAGEIQRGHPYPGQRYKHGWIPVLPLRADDDAIRGTFNYEDSEAGVRAEVVDIYRAAFYTSVQIEMHDRTGARVGTAQRIFDERTPNSIEHSSLELTPGMQGQGFATRFNAHAEAGYRRAGIEQITLDANLDVGGYAWARAGYDFANEASRISVVSHAESMAAFYPPDVQRAIERVVRNPNSTPIEFAMIGHTPGATTWPGKEIMLGAGWDGVKRL